MSSIPAPGGIIVGKQGVDMTAWIMVASVAVALTANGVVRAQSTGAMGSSPSSNSILLVDSTGKVAARPLNDTIMLISVSSVSRRLH